MSRRRSLVLALLVVTLAALVVANVLVRRGDDEDLTATRTSALAAVPSVEKLLSYDYRTLSADLARNKALTTGGFTALYQSIIDTNIVPNAVAQERVTTTTAAASGVLSASHDEVSLLVFLSQVTRAKVLAAPTTDLSAVQVTLVRTDGQWKVKDLKALQPANR